MTRYWIYMADYTPIVMPRDNPNDETVEILEWRLPNASRVERGVTIAIVETSKAAVEVDAPTDGFLFFRHEVGTRIRIGEAIAYIANDPGFDLGSIEKRIRDVPAAREARFTRKARELIRQHRLDDALFADLELVRERDVIERGRLAGGSDPDAGTSSSGVAPVVRRSVSAAKATEVRNLERSSHSVIYSKIVREVGTRVADDALAAVRKHAGLDVTLGELLVYACARALPAFELLNACYRDGAVDVYSAVHVGIAMSLDAQGLKVPVIHDATQLSLAELSMRIKEYALKYMRGKLTVRELTGGTFTISDLSSMNVTSFDPLISRGQSAILGICSPGLGRASFNLVVAFDHRVTDGMYAAQFANALVDVVAAMPGKDER